MTNGETAAADSGVPEAATFRTVRELLRTFGDSRWTAMTLELDGLKITAGKDGPPAAAAVAAAPVAASTHAGPALAGPAPAGPAAPPLAPAPAGPPPARPAAGRPPGSCPAAADLDGCVPVRSPAIGSFWVAPGPGHPPFVEVGQQVAEGEQIAIVEVMKLMNPVTAPQSGQVAAVCAANAELVEFDAVLFWLRPDDE